VSLVVIECSIEKLNIKELSPSKLVKSFSDVGWDQFLSRLKMKAEHAR
jgi:transposase